jgi:hypothetical protein
MRSLGGVEFPESVQWLDQYQFSPVAQEQDQTLGGQAVVYSMALTNGRPVTIELEDNETWADQDFVDSIMAMASQAGAVFTFIWDNDETFNVMFRHHDPPAVAFSPIWPNHHLFIGTIKIIQV